MTTDTSDTADPDALPGSAVNVNVSASADGQARGTLQVLLIEDDPDHAQLVRRKLAGAVRHRMEMDWADRLDEGLERLPPSGPAGLEAAVAAAGAPAPRPPDVVLLDLQLPDSAGVASLHQVIRRCPRAPVIVLTAQGEIDAAVELVQQGAQDYLLKNGLAADTLERAILYAIERKRNSLRMVELNEELERLNAELSVMAKLDGLTGIANRRAFDGNLLRECRRAARADLPLSLVLLDVDHFKGFNDLYGHLRGDVCLKAVADAIGGCLRRPGDMLARYGGEEFAVVLPNTEPDGAVLMADRIRDAIRDMAMPHGGSSVARVVTVSTGVATLLPGDSGEPQDVIDCADEALYRAKAAGRDCTRHALVAAAAVG